MNHLFNWRTFQHMTSTLVLFYFWTRWMVFPLLLLPLLILVWWVERKRSHA